MYRHLYIHNVITCSTLQFSWEHEWKMNSVNWSHLCCDNIHDWDITWIEFLPAVMSGAFMFRLLCLQKAAGSKERSEECRESSIENSFQEKISSVWGMCEHLKKLSLVTLSIGICTFKYIDFPLFLIFWKSFFYKFQICYLTYLNYTEILLNCFYYIPY